MSYCTSVTTNDKLFIQPFELCSLVALDRLKTKFPAKTDVYSQDFNYIFNANFKTANSDINSSLRDDNNHFIYEYNKNKKDLCYQINDKNEWNVNCAIKHFSPLYTYDNKTKTCTFIPNVKLADGFLSNKEKGQNYIYFDVNENNNPDYPLYKYQKRKAFCENKWYDWMVVPNYHLGNQYERDSGAYSKRDVRKCYKPCGKGMFPYLTSENQKICIPKTEAFDGAYAKKLDYSPLALINLIGNSKETLKDLFYVMVLEKFSNYKKDQVQPIPDLLSNIDVNDEIENNGFPSLILALFKNIISKETIDIGNIESNTSIITYKNPYFNEDEEELYTLRGMANAEIMNDIILVHTFLLAKKYHEFITSFIRTKTNYYDDKSSITIKYEKIIEHEFNLYRVLKNKFNFLNENKDEDLYDIKGFNDLKNIYRSDIDNNNLHKYYQRLANILYKAIDVCYNDETNFSKNLIIYTKRAYSNVYNIINQFINIDQSKKIDPNFKNNFLSSSLYKELVNPADLNDFTIRIPFIDIKDGNRTPIKTFIKNESSGNDASYVLLINELFINEIYEKFYNRDKNNQQVFFYTQEDIEKKSNCPSRKIPDINNNCSNCTDICNNKEKCIENKNCAIYCEKEYYDYVTKANLNANDRNAKCGIAKTSKEAVTKSNGKKIYETPIEESMKLPDFGNLLNIFIKIIFVLLAIYISYIFYQIYGETVFTLINWLLYYLGWLVFASYFKVRSLYRWLFNITDNDNMFNKIMRDYERSNATNKYKRVVNTINDLVSQIRQ